MTPTTSAGQHIVARLDADERLWAERTDEPDLNNSEWLTASSRRDQLRDVLRWLPREIAEAEMEAVRLEADDCDRIDRVLDTVR